MFFLVFMVSSSVVRVVCPSVSFLFVHLRASLDTSCAFLPSVGNFVFEGCGLGVVLGKCSLCVANRSIGLGVW